jgi:hypothetical protein
MQGNIMLKKIENGLVAVLYSPGYGAGWYSWHDIKELLFDPKVVDMVLEKTSAETIELYCQEVYGVHYYNGASDLEVAWVPAGTEFIVEDFDGNESIRFKDKVTWVTA